MRREIESKNKDAENIQTSEASAPIIYSIDETSAEACVCYRASIQTGRRGRFIGIDIRSFQNSGKGSRLLEEIIEHSQRDSGPIYLETSVGRHLPWYKKFEFEIFQFLFEDENLRR